MKTTGNKAIAGVLLAGILMSAAALAGNDLDVIQMDFGIDLDASDRMLISGGVIAQAKRHLEPIDETALFSDDSAPVRTRTQPPLVEVFEAVHFDSITGLLRTVAGTLRAAPADGGAEWMPPILSGNLAGGLHYGRWPEAARVFDCLNNELDVAALHKDLAHFLGIAAMSEAVGTVSLVMPSAASNRAWNEKENPQAYARGTGLTYALGGHMHVPWCLYDGSQFQRFYGSLKGHQPIFQMIHENRNFFDGYVSALWHLMEVPYGATGISNLKSLEETLYRAFSAGIPVTLRFRDERRFDADLAVGPRRGVEEEDELRFGADRLSGTPVSRHVLGEDFDFQTTPGPLAMIDGFDGVFLPPVPRVSAESGSAPLAVHLIRGFGGEQSPVPVRFLISGKWLPAGVISKLTIASVRWEGDPQAAVHWEATAEGDTLVTVTGVSAWAVVRVETSQPVFLSGIERSAFRRQMPESEIPLMRMIRFGTQWQRPSWVEEALSSGTDPLDGYHINRITWSYEDSGAELSHARQKNWNFHGSVALLHTHMGDPDAATLGIIRRPRDWPGWVRYSDGHPMLIRPDWNPPRYGASFASPEYRQAVIGRCREWLAMGVAGIQFDDVSGMLNRVWKYGGDFSDAMFLLLRQRLLLEGFPGVSEGTTLDDLRQRVVKEMHGETACQIVNVSQPGNKPSGWISVPYRATSAGYPGQVWIGPQPFARSGGRLTAEYDVRFSGNGAPHVDFLLMDGDRSTYISRVSIRKDAELSIPVKEWLRFRLEYNFAEQTCRYAVGDGPWSKAVPFEQKLLDDKQQTFAVAVMADPLRCGLDLRQVDVNQKESEHAK